MKRKSTDENAAAAATEAGHSKKRRLSHEEAHATAATETKRAKKDKAAKKDPKEKGKKDKKTKKTREEQAAALDAVYDRDDMDVDSEPQAADGADRPQDDAAAGAKSAQPVAAEEKKKKKKKSKKEKKPAEPQAGEDGAGEDGAHADAGQPPPSKKAARFIVFVGNLPYSATVDDIQKHFAAVHPTAVRLMHEKANPAKSRGIAFVEFAGYDHMKTCLKTLHHSTLACEGRDHRGRPRAEERKINVELTAGGGGNTDHRKEKIRAKNEKLAGERHRRAEAEEKEKLKKEKKRLLEGGEKKGDDEGVHPSRRARVPGGRR